LKPFACTACTWVFARKHDLERHTRKHTGKKPYACHACHSCFARSDARRRH
ncbi:Krueppel-like factor 5, partial [Gongronella butleri]